MSVTNGSVLRVIAKLADVAQDVYNVYHLYIDGTTTLTDLQFVSMLASLLDTAYTEINAAVHEDVTYESVQAYNLTTSEELGEVAWPALVDGSATLDKLPPQCAALVLFDTTTPNSQGRKFLPVFAEGNNEADGTMNTATLALVAAYAADFVTPITLDTGEAVWGNWNASAQTFSEWELATVRDFYATQRRRYVGSGS